MSREYAEVQAELRAAAARIGALTGMRAANDTPTEILERFAPEPAVAPTPRVAEDWSIRWTAFDWLLVPLALLLSIERRRRGTHRWCRGAVRRHGTWHRPGAARPATTPDTRGTWRAHPSTTAGWATRGGPHA